MICIFLECEGCGSYSAFGNSDDSEREGGIMMYGRMGQQRVERMAGQWAGNSRTTVNKNDGNKRSAEGAKYYTRQVS
jgi:hypothetical protein